MATATYDLIASTTLGSAGLSITFSSIPSTYTDLRVIMVGLLNGNAVQLTFNNNTSTSAYSSTELYANGSTAGSRRDTTSPGNGYIFLEAYGSSPSSLPAFYSIDVFSYAGSTYKTCLIMANEDANGSGYVGATVGLYQSTSAINRLDLTSHFSNFAIGTTATLYGIKAA